GEVMVIGTGLEVNEALVAAQKLAEEGISAEVINMHTIKPLDEEAVLKAAEKTGKTVTVEEHSVIGGLGSAVCDVVAQKACARVMKIGVNDTFGESGPAVELIKKYELDGESIYKKVKGFLGKYKKTTDGSQIQPYRGKKNHFPGTALCVHMFTAFS